MKIDHFFYAVQTYVVFTETDVDAAIRCSQRHYDSKCRAASKPGGFLYGMKKSSEYCDETEDVYELSWQQLDLLQKILEQAVDEQECALYETVREIFAATRRESERVNGQQR